MTAKNNESKKTPNYESLTHGAWTTHDEEEFIEQLGSWTRNSLPRGILLAKYLNFMTSIRTNFGAINKDKAIAFTKKMMSVESKAIVT
jgi:hypothetical protein